MVRAELNHGRHERWLFENKDTLLALWRVTEFSQGEKSVWFEVRRDYPSGSFVLLESDDFRHACDYANGK